MMPTSSSAFASFRSRVSPHGVAAAWVADDAEDDDLTYVQMTCLACAQAHLVNPKTGKVLGAADDE